MKTRPLLIATALFCAASARAEPPLDVCTVVTNTKGPQPTEVPCPVEDDAPTDDDEPADTADTDDEP